MMQCYFVLFKALDDRFWAKTGVCRLILSRLPQVRGLFYALKLSAELVWRKYLFSDRCILCMGVVFGL